MYIPHISQLNPSLENKLSMQRTTIITIIRLTSTDIPIC